MADISKLRSDWEKAEQQAQQLMAEKDKALADVRKKYSGRVAKATDRAAAAQKKLNDAEAAQAIRERDDLDEAGKRSLAKSLGLDL